MEIGESTDMARPLDPEANPEVEIDMRLVASLSPGWGAALRRLFERSDVNQAEVAEAIGVDKSTITGWISERYKPRSTDLFLANS
jgi:DNA-binding transcriptional regulator YiaG